MITQQEEIYRQLDDHGWRKVEDAEPDEALLGWWAREVWVLESLWHPQECRVYLTFARADEGISYVTAALDGPAQWSEVELGYERPGRRKEGLPEFFAGLAGLRAAWEKARTEPPPGKEI